MKIDYTKTGVTPEEYVCGQCGISGVKLWREYNTFHPKLLCALCAASAQNKDISDMGEDGRYENTGILGGTTDQIGWYVPAIPDEEDIGYWGYTSVPIEGVNWWKALKTFSR